MSYSLLKRKISQYDASIGLYAKRNHNDLALFLYQTPLPTFFADKEIKTVFELIVKSLCEVDFKTLLKTKDHYKSAVEDALTCLEIESKDLEDVPLGMISAWLKSALHCFDYWVKQALSDHAIAIQTQGSWVKETSMYDALSAQSGLLAESGQHFKYAYQIRSQMEHRLSLNKKTNTTDFKQLSKTAKKRLFQQAIDLLKVALSALHSVYTTPPQ